MTIGVYTLNNELIKTLYVGRGIDYTPGVENTASWDGRNEKGEKVASGTYLYVVKSQYGHKVAKITIIK